MHLVMYHNPDYIFHVFAEALNNFGRHCLSEFRFKRALVYCQQVDFLVDTIAACPKTPQQYGFSY